MANNTGAVCVSVPVELIHRLEKHWELDPHNDGFVTALCELLNIADGVGVFCPQWDKKEYERILRESMQERDAVIAELDKLIRIIWAMLHQEYELNIQCRGDEWMEVYRYVDKYMSEKQ